MLNLQRCLAIPTLIVAIPFVFVLLGRLFPQHGLLWLGAELFYYLPLSSLGEPFFTPNSDVGFVPAILGRVVTPIVYVLIWFLALAARRKLSASRG